MKKSLIVLAFSLLIPIYSFAQTQAPGSSLRAYKLAKEKRWLEANIEAKSATEAQPKDAEAWFMLGLTEERLEHLSQSVSAYDQYLKLAPSQSVALAVESKMLELKDRAKRQGQDIYGTNSSGIFLEKSFTYSPSFVAEVNGNLTAPFAVGFHWGKGFIGYKRATGTFTDSVKIPNSSGKTLVYNTVSGGGSLSHQELFANIFFSLIDPYTSWGNVQLALPFFAAGYMNTISTNSDSKKYGNVGYDFGLGLALRGFTRSPFTWYVQGIYHIGIPFWAIQEGGSDNAIQNSKSQDIAGNVNGFEVGAGLSFMFGSETSKHY